MKALTNWSESICLDCGLHKTASFDGEEVKCSFCESDMFFDKDGDHFIPTFISDRRHQDLHVEVERRSP